MFNFSKALAPATYGALISLPLAQAVEALRNDFTQVVHSYERQRGLWNVQAALTCLAIGNELAAAGYLRVAHGYWHPAISRHMKETGQI